MNATFLKPKLTRAALLSALVFSAAAFAAPAAQAQISIGISVGFAPPALPVYVQPPLPAPGYLWTPGYWAYGDAGYFWVPGVWVQPPNPGLLWTPPYWGFAGGSYGFHAGYWGPHVGFYGGVNYGFGFGGVGFVGGAWNGGVFSYNSACANFGGTHVTNVYNNTTIIRQNTIINNNHISYNGGNGGVNAQPSAQQQQWAHEQHVQPTANQMQHQTFAARDRGQLASVNGGRPSTMAADNVHGYQQMAQRNAQMHPISQQDRVAGKAYQPNMRGANQDQRIANGLKSGQMTSGEAARAERNQANVDQQVHADRAANGGRLTGQERQQVNREQNADSRQIYNEKHNGNTIAPNEVNNREANQEQRIANGERSGQMTSGEAARANNRQGFMDQQVHDERAANRGALTQQQRQQANRQQNSASRQIYNQNHNGATHNMPAPHPAPHEAPGSGGERKR